MDENELEKALERFKTFTTGDVYRELDADLALIREAAYRYLSCLS